MDEDDIELEVCRSKDERRSKSCDNSPSKYLKTKFSKTVFHAELIRYKERSFHGRSTRYETINRWKRSLSTPNIFEQKPEEYNVITEVHMRTNDITLKVIKSPDHL